LILNPDASVIGIYDDELMAEKDTLLYNLENVIINFFIPLFDKKIKDYHKRLYPIITEYINFCLNALDETDIKNFTSKMYIKQDIESEMLDLTSSSDYSILKNLVDNQSYQCFEEDLLTKPKMSKKIIIEKLYKSKLGTIMSNETLAKTKLSNDIIRSITKKY
jgi:hypothetical protein